MKFIQDEKVFQDSCKEEKDGGKQLVDGLRKSVTVWMPDHCPVVVGWMRREFGLARLDHAVTETKGTADTAADSSSDCPSSMGSWRHRFVAVSIRVHGPLIEGLYR